MNSQSTSLSITALVSGRSRTVATMGLSSSGSSKNRTKGSPRGQTKMGITTAMEIKTKMAMELANTTGPFISTPLASSTAASTCSTRHFTSLKWPSTTPTGSKSTINQSTTNKSTHSKTQADAKTKLKDAAVSLPQVILTCTATTQP